MIVDARKRKGKLLYMSKIQIQKERQKTKKLRFSDCEYQGKERKNTGHLKKKDLKEKKKDEEETEIKGL